MSDNIIQLNEDLIKNNLKDLVRSSVEETLNALLDHEADELVNAERYERSGDRKGYRSGHYERNFSTTSGNVKLRVPKLKGIQFETAIIERYKRRECSVEEALIAMYPTGVSVRRVEDITETLWGIKVFPGTIRNLYKKAYGHIEQWRQRPLLEEYSYVHVDGIYLKRSWGGKIQNVSVLVAISVNRNGYREIIGAAEGMKVDKCFRVTPKNKMRFVMLMLKAIHAQESKEAALAKDASVAAKLCEIKLSAAAKKVEESVDETPNESNWCFLGWQ
jgi:putative transposase